MVTERFIAESRLQERAPRCVRLGKCEQDIRFSLLNHSRRGVGLRARHLGSRDLESQRWKMESSRRSPLKVQHVWRRALHSGAPGAAERADAEGHSSFRLLDIALKAPVDGW